jgi:diguanylate cyclase (GGDEF)-like protein
MGSSPRKAAEEHGPQIGPRASVFFCGFFLLCSSVAEAAVQGPAAIAADPTEVSPRGLLGVGGLIVAALLFLLYFYRRRLYILYWSGGWLLAAFSMFLGTGRFPNVEWGRLAAYGFSQFLGILSALFFVVAADAYRSRPRLRRNYGLLLMPLLLWFTLAPVALGTKSVFAPGHVLIAGGFVAAGVAHLLLLRQARLLGAAVVGIMLLLIASTNIWMAVAIPSPNDPAAGQTLILTLVLYLVTALGMQLLTFEDMTYELRRTNRRLESAQSELRQMVITDPLTGCRNRRFFDEVIERELHRHRRYNQPLSLLFIDINRFKAINDTLGHEAGDRVLRKVAAFLVRNIREADYVFRWGGDEFLVLITCREVEARRRGTALQEAFAESSDAAALPPGVGLSIGCVEVPHEAPDVMSSVKVADERMYANKRAMK